MRLNGKPGFVFGIIIFNTVMLTAAGRATACTCIESYAPWIAEFSDADAVFVGKVNTVVPIKFDRNKKFVGDRLVTFEIKKVYKGVGASTRLISLYSDYESTSCSQKGPSIGETWIVLARKNDSPQMFFGGSCDSSSKVSSKGLKNFETEVFKFPQKQGILGSVVRNYMSLVKDVEVTLQGEGTTQTTKVDAEGYYWFPLEKPSRYTVTGRIPFYTTLISAVWFPSVFESSESGTIYTYTIDLKEGEYHYNEVNVNDPSEDPFSKYKKDAGRPASFD